MAQLKALATLLEDGGWILNTYEAIENLLSLQSKGVHHPLWHLKVPQT